MDLRLADQAYQTGTDGGAEIVCKNMFAAPTPSVDGRGYELLSVPGLEEFVDLEDSIRDWIAVEGLFGGDIFAVAANRLVRIDRAGTITDLGTLPFTGTVTMAATRIELAICVAPNLYIYDGTTLTQNTDPDLPNVYSVTELNQRFIVTDENDRSYWTNLLDGGSVDGLDFFTAESHPDKLVRSFSDGEKFYNMGSVSTETMGAVTNPSSSSNAFARLGSGVIKSGLAGVHAVAVDVNSLTVVFLGNERIVYATQGYEPQAISTPYIERRLHKASSDAIAATRIFAYSDEGENFFVMNVPNIGTFVYGKRLQKWHTRETFGKTNWRANMCVQAFGEDYVASAGENKIWRMSRSIANDAGKPISREFSASIAIRGINSVSEIMLDGYADRNCAVSMRRRLPGKKRLYSGYVDRFMQSPDREYSATWRRLGKTLPPEEIFNFRITDDACVTISGARANDMALRA